MYSQDFSTNELEVDFLSDLVILKYFFLYPEPCRPGLILNYFYKNITLMYLQIRLSTHTLFLTNVEAIKRYKIPFRHLPSSHVINVSLSDPGVYRIESK